MENVTVNKSEVLAVLKTNREKHKAIFEEALIGYKNKAINLLEERLAEAKSGKYIKVHVVLAEPTNQTKDYDRAIKMLEMSINDTIELSEEDFQHYVLDDWFWKQQFLTSNAFYSGTASAMLAQ